MEKPIHEHDCDKCIFLGTFNEEDLYFCLQGGNNPTVIARYGENGDYSSGLSFGEREKDDMTSSMGEAYRRSRLKKLIYDKLEEYV